MSSNASAGPRAIKPPTVNPTTVDYYQKYGKKMLEDLTVYHQLTLWPEKHQRMCKMKFWRMDLVAPISYLEPAYFATKGRALQRWLNLCNKSTFLYDATERGPEFHLFPKIYAKWASLRNMEEVYDERFVAARIRVDGDYYGPEHLLARHLELYAEAEQYLAMPREEMAKELEYTQCGLGEKDRLIDATLHPSCKAAFLVADDDTYKTLLVVLTGSNEGLNVGSNFLSFDSWSPYVIERPTPYSARMSVEHAVAFVRAIDVENQKSYTKIQTRCIKRRITLMTKSLPRSAECTLTQAQREPTDRTWWSKELKDCLARVMAAEDDA